MGGYHTFYESLGKGLNSPSYGLAEPYQDPLFQGFSYRTPASSVGVPTDPRTANQLKAVSDRLNTGAKVVEVSAVQPQILESIPKQHFEEVRRLTKLVGTELTLHGPVVEPTGLTREGWDEGKRMEAERQMWHAVEKSHELDSKGNIVVTFHSSGLPELEEKYKTEKGEEKVGDLLVIDERKGDIARIKPRELHLSKEKGDPKSLLENLNKESWESSLSRASFHAYEGNKIIEVVKDEFGNVKIPDELKGKLSEKDLINIYKDFRSEEGQKILEQLDPEVKKFANQLFNKINYGEIYLRDSYNELQTLFDQAYEVALKRNTPEDKKILNKLNAFREEIAPLVEKGNLKDVGKLEVFGEKIIEGLKLLSTMKAPEMYRPLKDFAIDKASETFANLSLRAYSSFKEKAPIISIENPPAGMMGLSRAEDLKKLVEEARKKFVEKATQSKDLGLSKKEAEELAQKLIGVTWDVGHINMLRKYGYSERDITEQTEKIAKLVKHVHLSDNFGLEHTELPMGMGNVPIKQHMELLEKYNKQLKKIAETANWYEHFKRTPLTETFSALGSPFYGSAGAYWNEIRTQGGGYFAGFGYNPDIHHSLYGAGFSNLPVELGGQMQGKSRLTGTPME